MNIRSITYFVHPHAPIQMGGLDLAAVFIAEARPAFEKAGYPVQTARLATVPFPELLPPEQINRLPDLAQSLEGEAKSRGYDYLALGAALPNHLESYQAIPQAIASTQNVFFSGIMANPGMGVSLPAVRACAQVIHRAAGLESSGFANLRFAALANVPPGAPFFPAAYHQGNTPAFALATESADLAVRAFAEAASLDDARQRLKGDLERHGRMLASVSRYLSRRFKIQFGGIDFSLAPFPEEARSLGFAMERLGAPGVGRHGSLAAASILAEALDRAKYPRTGFSGLMIPVLEDTTLAARAAEGLLTVKDLLLYAAVCGTGLDTVPLPGDTAPEQIAAILLDLAALSERLKKPLTARLMPIPGKKAGDRTDFDFAYFANSRVMAVEAVPAQGFLSGSESFSLYQRG